MGYLLLGLAIFYRFINIIIKQLNGEDIPVFLYLYSVIKNAVEGILVTMMIAISWGWSLTHIKFSWLFAGISGPIILLQVTAFMVWVLSKDELDGTYLFYEHPLFKVLLGVRVLLFVFFGLGCFKLAGMSVGKRRHFAKNFGRLGAIFLLGWPLAVLICELLFPKYMINRIITIFEDGLHIMVNAHICWLFAFPDSDYKKISIKDDEEIIANGELPSYINIK
jgi:hypothetical protein